MLRFPAVVFFVFRHFLVLLNSALRTVYIDVGLKVTGGKMTPAGRLGAFITKVKRGSIADVVGQLKSGLYIFIHVIKSFSLLLF